MSYRLSPRAEDDIVDTALFIAADNPTAALRWAERMRDNCRKLGEMPGMGSPRPQVHAGLRIWPVGNYLVLYVEAVDGVDILRVVHGARDQANWS